jgi:hypothetical protein
VGCSMTTKKKRLSASEEKRLAKRMDRIEARKRLERDLGIDLPVLPHPPRRPLQEAQ